MFRNLAIRHTQALLRRAIAQADAGDVEEAAERLAAWTKYAPVVENGFLRALRDRAGSLLGNRPHFVFPGKGLTSDIKEAKRTLVRWALEKHEKQVKPAAREFKTDLVPFVG